MNGYVPVAGWTLIHFLWQGAGVALVTAVALRAARHASANVRYIIACVGLAAMLAAPIATAGRLSADMATADARLVSGVMTGARAISDDGATSAARGATAARATAIDNDRRASDRRASAGALSALLQSSGAARLGAGVTNVRVNLDRIIRAVVFVWVLGVAALLGRMAAGWWYVRRLHRTALAAEPSEWQRVSTRLSARLGLRRAAHVVESVLVEVPTVVGWLRPAIVLPVAAIAQLTPSQVEAILAHELAHIRRCDYAVNLAQTLAETLLFYHPAVWWLSARIRTEREHCCDDIAVAMCGDALGYAEALTELEQWRTASSVLALAATDGSLLNRVRRILRVPVADEPESPSWAFTLALTALFTAGAGGLQSVPVTVVRAAQALEARVVAPDTGALLPAPERGVANGIRGGISGGVTGGVSGGVTGGISEGVAGGQAALAAASRAAA